MRSHAIGFGAGALRCYPDEPMLCLSWSSVNTNLSNICGVRNMPSNFTGVGFHNFAHVHRISCEKSSPFYCFLRTYSVSTGLEEQSSSGYAEFQDNESDFKHTEDGVAKTLSSNELKSLVADSHRSKLVKKLSEANQHNRFLKRQLQGREDALVNFKSELAVLELEIQALVMLADEIAKAGIPVGSRKINGKYIQSHLVSRLEAVQQKLQDQIKDVAAAQAKEVTLYWIGVAESVQVMGSFDGWSQGEQLSPEYTSSYSQFSTTLLLRPGRYEIKFLVDGEWHISPEFPTVGEGPTENNLLVVQ